ncbi:isocyanide synthase family protein [Streptomyces yunnanensis]|uniref:Isocyanide synthase family protein n=1 Tax=Streptomyces yunnanensis TaxID=156453 RepID=A0ABY8AGK2_9ACTN|nr:L-tyrosine/L-tryptophan isonitrile synthase family protein [Streptomyces yunnanensis]WEB44154.1 isocyanide synthase family protein [Streptomyces yunnanensis]
MLGPLPDEGERPALRFPDRLCARIAAVYPPGARVAILLRRGVPPPAHPAHGGEAVDVEVGAGAQQLLLRDDGRGPPSWPGTGSPARPASGSRERTGRPAGRGHGPAVLPWGP